jgi:hypothetical protein
MGPGLAPTFTRSDSSAHNLMCDMYGTCLGGLVQVIEKLLGSSSPSQCDGPFSQPQLSYQPSSSQTATEGSPLDREASMDGSSINLGTERTGSGTLSLHSDPSLPASLTHVRVWRG